MRKKREASLEIARAERDHDACRHGRGHRCIREAELVRVGPTAETDAAVAAERGILDRRYEGHESRSQARVLLAPAAVPVCDLAPGGNEHLHGGDLAVDDESPESEPVVGELSGRGPEHRAALVLAEAGAASTGPPCRVQSMKGGNRLRPLGRRARERRSAVDALEPAE